MGDLRLKAPTLGRGVVRCPCNTPCDRPVSALGVGYNSSLSEDAPARARGESEVEVSSRYVRKILGERRPEEPFSHLALAAEVSNLLGKVFQWSLGGDFSAGYFAREKIVPDSN